MRSSGSRRSGANFLSVAMDAARMGAFHFDVEKNRLTYSDELLALLGIDKSQFGGTIEAVEALKHPDDVEHCRKALAASERLDHEFRIIRPDGEVRWIHASGNIVRRRDGTPTEVYGVKQDITERKLAEEHHGMLLAEVNHRMRNSLAQMGLIIERSRVGADSVDAFATALTDRLDALARAHARFNRANFTGVRLRELVEDAVTPYRSNANVSVEGSDLPLKPQAAQALAMVLHELATNAWKYGALTTTDGRVVVRWQVAGEISSAQLCLVWMETGGPTVDAPMRQGFGTRLIRNIVEHELGGRVDLSLPPTGVQCEIAVPLARVARKLH